MEDEVYIGAYSVVGSACLRKGCLIGTRANLLSGSTQHELSDDGRWTPFDLARSGQIEIGPHAWIGESAVVMADVGAGALVAAGSVVSTAVPPGVVVAGNPARFVRQLKPQSAAPVEPPVAVAVPRTKPGYEPFIDWLKCLGMILIVFGHTAAWARLATLPPIYSKQLGVAFFLFIAGFSLSRETRERWHVAFNRLFEVYLFGLALALFMSTVKYLTLGTIQKSNYAPLLGGMNVLFDFFPANPTTWYLGTYIHVIVLWALVGYRIRVSTRVLIGSFMAEVAIRAILMQMAGHMISYMVLPNWLTVLLLGAWYGQQRHERSVTVSDHAALGAGVALVAAVVVWLTVSASLPLEHGFPFMQFAGRTSAPWILLVSALVSTVYLSVTWLTFRAVGSLPAPAPVRFVARNTLVIFLAHMPVVYALQPVLEAWGLSRNVNAAALMVVCIFGLALLSQALHRVIKVQRWRDLIWARIGRRATTPALASPLS